MWVLWCHPKAQVQVLPTYLVVFLYHFHQSKHHACSAGSHMHKRGMERWEITEYSSEVVPNSTCNSRKKPKSPIHEFCFTSQPRLWSLELPVQTDMCSLRMSMVPDHLQGTFFPSPLQFKGKNSLISHWRCLSPDWGAAVASSWRL